MFRSPAVMISLAAVAMLAACASQGGPSGPRYHGGGGGDGVPRGVPNLFISPAGKPYHAGKDQPYPVAQWFASANTAQDGHLTLAEFRADAASFFKELDADQNGMIDGFEVQHYERVIAPEINPSIEGLRFGEGMDLSLGQEGARGSSIGRGGAQSSSREQAGDQRPEGAGVFGLLNEPEPVAATDVKFDSHITLDGPAPPCRSKSRICS